MRPSHGKNAPRKSAARAKSVNPDIDLENVKHLRSLAHDLSNALEAILQACYLLNNAELSSNSRRWLHLIDTSSQEAARINREIRKSLRALSGE